MIPFIPFLNSGPLIFLKIRQFAYYDRKSYGLKIAPRFKEKVVRQRQPGVGHLDSDESSFTSDEEDAVMGGQDGQNGGAKKLKLKKIKINNL